MTESNQAPLLSLTPEAPDKELDEVVASIQEKPAAPAAQTAPKLDSSQLTPAERKAIDDFEKQIDVSNPDHILLFGADAQKKIADFSDTALEAVKTQDTGEIGDMLVNLVTELKGFEADAEEPKGLRKLFSNANTRMEGMKARYTKVSGNVENIASSLEQYQVQLLKDVAMFNRLYEMNLTYFRELSMYIMAGEMRLKEIREGDLEKLRAKAA